MTLTRSLATLVTAGLLLPAYSQAQEKKKAVLPTAVKPQADVERRKRKRAEKAAPKVRSETMLRGRSAKQQSEAKWRESFRLLQELIKATPEGDPQKPELWYRLSEMHWERASSTTLLAFIEEEKCLKAAGSNDAAANACTSRRKAGEAKAAQFREDAIKVYKHIVRNFPNYNRLDGVLFALGFNFQQKNDHEGAKKIYVELIKRYPRSRHVPDTLLNVGEIFFEAGQVDQALKAYQKVATNYRDSSVYGYALYKLGWCYFNLGQHQEAMRQFIKVIEHSNKATRGRNRVTLRKEAQRDLVRSYVHIESANPNRAIGFFRKVAPDDYMDLSEKLAELYTDTGQFEKSNQLYRQLIKMQKGSYKIVSYQIQIVYNTRSIGKQVQAVKEMNRLVTLWASVKDAKDAEPDRVQKDRRGIEEQLRGMAVQYHNQWYKTKSDEDAAIAVNLYRDYVKVFPDQPNAYDMNFYYAELLYQLEKWKDSAERYEAALKIKGDGPHTKEAAHGLVLAYKKMLVTSVKPPTAVDETLDKVPEAKPLTNEYERFIAACDLYKKYVKDSKYLVDIEYDAARIYYDFNQFDKAAPRFQEISEKHVNHRLAVYAANLLLDIHILKKDYSKLNAQADDFLKLYTKDRDEEFYTRLVNIKQTSKFKECQQIEGGKRWTKAARCYMQYARKFPDSDVLDKAYYNAALNFERDKRIENAIQTRLLLVNNVSGSDLVPKALYQIAGSLHALAIYSKASEAYEFYANKFPQNEEAKDALKNAAAFRRGLGQLDKASENYLAYMKLIGKDKQKAADVFFSLGLILEKQEKWDAAIDHFEKFLKKYGSVAVVDRKIEAYTRIGNAYMAKKRKDTKKAQKAYAKAYSTFNGLSTGQEGDLTSAIGELRTQLGLAEQLSMASLLPGIHGNLAEAYLGLGDVGQAAKHQLHCLDAALAVGQTVSVAYSCVLAAQTAANDRVEEALLLQGAADAILSDAGYQLFAADLEARGRLISRLSARERAERVDELLSAGAELSLLEATGRARAELALTIDREKS